jgi:hypothetical protein
MAAAGMVSDDIKAIMGIFDPAQQGQGNISGTALKGQQQQVDLTNYDYYDNLTRSIAHVGKICLDLIPKIYDTQRILRIIGEDGKSDMLNLNQRDAVGNILNDTSIGQYDVVMETGPGYNSKRQEAVDAMMPLLSKPELFNIAGDLVFRNMDFPGADIIADRLAAMNPMSQIDEKSDIPPQVQMQIAQSKQQMQQMQQQLEAMTTLIQQRGDIEQVKQDNENKRELMRQTAKAHNTEIMAEVKVNDQNTRSLTSQNKTEIDAIVQLLLHRMDTSRLIEEIEKRNAEQDTTMLIAAQDIADQANPLTQQQ